MCAPATNSDLCQQKTNMSMPIVLQAPSLETTGHVYQDTEAFSHKLGNNWTYEEDTEAFCHTLSNSSEAKKIRNVTFHMCLEKKIRRIWTIKKNSGKNGCFYSGCLCVSKIEANTIRLCVFACFGCVIFFTWYQYNTWYTIYRRHIKSTVCA